MELFSKWCQIAIVVIQSMALIGMLLFFVSSYLEIRWYTREALKIKENDAQTDVQKDEGEDEAEL